MITISNIIMRLSVAINQNMALKVFLVSLVSTAFIFISARQINSYRPMLGDAHFYYNAAYNLHNYGVFTSEETIENGDIKPSHYRAPGYPFYLSLLMSLDQRFTNKTLSQTKDSKTLNKLKWLQVPLILIACLLTGYCLLMITKSWIFFFIGMSLMTLIPKVSNQATQFLTETLSLPLISTLVFLNLCYFFKQKLILALLIGLNLALLALTKPVFDFYWYFQFALIGFIALRKKLTYSKATVAAIGFALAFWLPIGSWKFRNLHEFGEFTITEGRGGRVMFYRSNFNKIPWEKLPAAFFFFGDSPWIKSNVLPHFVTNTEMKALGSIRSKNRSEYIQEYAEPMGLVESDRYLKKYAMSEIVSNLPKHGAVTIVMLHKGLKGFGRYWVSSILYLSLIISTFHLIRKKKFLLCATVFLPAYFSLLFHAFLTHGNPRYTFPLAPIFVISLSLVVYQAVQYLQEQRKEPLRTQKHRIQLNESSRRF